MKKKSRPLTDDEFKSFLLLRNGILNSFNESIENVRIKYPDIWVNKKSRLKLHNAFYYYFKPFFVIDRHRISKEQSQENKVKNSGYF